MIQVIAHKANSIVGFTFSYSSFLAETRFKSPHHRIVYNVFPVLRLGSGVVKIRIAVTEPTK